MDEVNQGRVFVPKGWGFEDWIANTEKYCCKVLFVKKGKKCSWHYHKVKDETFYLQSGKLLLRYFSLHELQAWLSCGWTEEEFCLNKNAHKTIKLSPGDSFHVPVGMRHQFEGLRDSLLIEASTFHEDADSIRVIKGD